MYRKALLSTALAMAMAGTAAAGTVDADAESRASIGLSAGAETGAGAMASESTEAVGSDALDLSGKKIGEVVEIVTDTQGRAQTVVIATTGILLGIGGRDVAVPAEKVSLDSEASIVAVTGNQIDEMPDYGG